MKMESVLFGEREESDKGEKMVYSASTKGGVINCCLDSADKESRRGFTGRESSNDSI